MMLFMFCFLGGTDDEKLWYCFKEVIVLGEFLRSKGRSSSKQEKRQESY